MLRNNVQYWSIYNIFGFQLVLEADFQKETL
jgi:hypothetical protein